jgi:hypothetical protein
MVSLSQHEAAPARSELTTKANMYLVDCREPKVACRLYSWLHKRS